MSGRVAQGVKYVVNSPGGQALAAGLAVEGLKSVHEEAGNLLGSLLEIAAQEPDAAALDNPFFVQNGHEGLSPRTNAYLQARKMFGTTGSLVAGILDVGGITSAAGAAQHAAVWYRINALYEKLVPPSRRAKPPEYAAWYSWQVAKKAVSQGSLEIQMTRIIRQKMYGTAGGAAKAGVAFGTGGLLGVFVNAAASQVQERLDALFGQDVQILAQGLHWHAFREQALSSGIAGLKGGKGPALRILEVLWQQLAFGRVSGVRLEEIVREPQGWLVVADVLA